MITKPCLKVVPLTQIKQELEGFKWPKPLYLRPSLMADPAQTVAALVVILEANKGNRAMLPTYMQLLRIYEWAKSGAAPPPLPIRFR